MSILGHPRILAQSANIGHYLWRNSYVMPMQQLPCILKGFVFLHHPCHWCLVRCDETRYILLFMEPKQWPSNSVDYLPHNCFAELVRLSKRIWHGRNTHSWHFFLDICSKFGYREVNPVANDGSATYDDTIYYIVMKHTKLWIKRLYKTPK